LKKPFHIFDSGQSIGSFRPPSGLTAPPAAPANNRRMNELIDDKRAERMLLEPARGDSELTDDDPLTTSEDSLDITGRKHKSPLERYYNKLDRERERSAFTNQVQNTDLFGNNKDPDAKDKFGRSFPDKSFGGDLKTSMNSSGQPATNAATGGGFFADDRKPKTFEDLLDGRSNDLTERSSLAKEARLDEFKRLLGDPPSAPRNNDNSPRNSDFAPRNNDRAPSLPIIGAAQWPATASPLPAWSPSPAAAAPRDSFSSRAGLVGTPFQLQSLPSFAATPPSLNPTPSHVLQPKQPTSSFSIPKRQF
jgi:hypothetical protein